MTDGDGSGKQTTSEGAVTKEQIERFKAAVEAGDSASVRRLFAQHSALVSQIDAPLFSFDSPAIVAAAGKPDTALIDTLLEFGADINKKSSWWAGGFGALHSVDDERAAYLIARGAVVDVHAAAHLGMLDKLRELIDADPALLNARGGDGMTPLHFASTLPVVEFLLDRGADKEIKDVDHESTPAQYAINEPEKLRYLVSRGAEADIFIACALGDVELAKSLLAKEPDYLQARIGKGKFTAPGGHIYLYKLTYTARPLHLAAQRGHDELVTFLLQHSTATERFLLACMQADAPAVRSLLAEQPGIVRSLVPEDASLICEAAWTKRVDAIRVMLEAGFDVDTRGAEHSTPLDRAAVCGYVDVIDLLLQYNASLEVVNAYGGTPLGACIWGSVNFRDALGDYPASVERLIAAGAPVPEKAWGSEEVAEILRRHGAQD